MRGSVYRRGTRRTGSILLALGAGLAFALAVILSSASAALARSHAVVQVRPPVVATYVTHAPPVRLPPSVIAHAAGHKIA